MRLLMADDGADLKALRADHQRLINVSRRWERLYKEACQQEAAIQADLDRAEAEVVRLRAFRDAANAFHDAIEEADEWLPYPETGQFRAARTQLSQQQGEMT